MCLEEESEDEVSDIAHIQEFSFHTVAVELRSLIDLMHIVFRNAKDNYDSRSLVEIEHG